MKRCRQLLHRSHLKLRGRRPRREVQGNRGQRQDILKQRRQTPSIIQICVPKRIITDGFPRIHCTRSMSRLLSHHGLSHRHRHRHPVLIPIKTLFSRTTLSTKRLLPKVHHLTITPEWSRLPQLASIGPRLSFTSLCCILIARSAAARRRSGFPSPSSLSCRRSYPIPRLYGIL